MDLKVNAWTFDVGTQESPVEAVVSRTEQSWDNGADVVLFPEYTWASLHPSPRGMAKRFKEETLPALQERLTRRGKLAVFGTSLFRDESSGKTFNRAPIMCDGQWLFQDKLFMTPWERAISSGQTLYVMNFQGWRVAVVICLDVEVPELSALLRGQGLDLLLVPSATDRLLGCERVTRCANARAVELGCAVAVSPLVGLSNSALVDENVGKLAHYLPSQMAFERDARIRESPLYAESFHCLGFTLRRERLAAMREATSETNPSLLEVIASTLPSVSIYQT